MKPLDSEDKMAPIKSYTKEDIDAAREIQDVHTTLKLLSADVKEGFQHINERLDGINGSVQQNCSDIGTLQTNAENHDEHHKDYEERIAGKVSFWGILASVVGATLAVAVSIVAWMKEGR